MTARKSKAGRKRPPSVAEGVAAQLRAEIIKLDEGTYLGSEAALMERFGISRPTFQQVTRILGHENLLVMRRGAGGGAFSARPTIAMVMRAVSTFLQTRGATQSDIIVPGPALGRAAVTLACDCNDKHLLSELQMFVQHELDKGNNILPEDATDACERRFQELLGRMSNNPAVQLMLAVFFEIASENLQRVFHLTSKRVLSVRRTRISLCRSILSRDHRSALEYWNDYVESAINWLSSDLGEVGLNKPFSELTS